MLEFLKVFILLFMVCILIIIFAYDLKYYLIPDKVVFPAIGMIATYRLFLNFGIWHYFFSALGAAGFFLAVVLITRGKGMGMGDVKLAFLMGLLLGWPMILPALFFAFFFGALVGVGLIIAGKKNMQSQIPFGPFLAAGTLLSLFYGLDICFFLKNLVC